MINNRPPATTWRVETQWHDGTWCRFGADWADDQEWMQERFRDVETSPRAFRLVRATTTYTTDAVNAAAETQRVDGEDRADQPVPPRRFVLRRHRDVSGISGTGDVADGVLWPDGTASIRWRGEHPSVVFWDRGRASVEQIHGHAGATEIVFLDLDEIEGVR